MTNVNIVQAYLLKLQDRICSALEISDGGQEFHEESWQRAEGGGGRSRVMKEGVVFEQAGVGFSDVSGNTLPASATAHRPELAGAPWRAVGVSLVIHPRNPYLPTAHANVRYFEAQPKNADPIWWFGGGFDLTPFTRSMKTLNIGIKSRTIYANLSAKTVTKNTSNGVINIFI